MKINIAQDLDLPIDAVTQTFAQIGRKGAGKTYLAGMIAEQMLDAEAQVIVIDPIGNWWGLRVDADGEKKGKEIFIIGGSHGDVPIASESGKEIAKLLAEKNISVVLDISEFRKNERKKFVTDFAEEFFQLKKTRNSPVHIFLEEAQKFVPQRVMSDDARMLGAWEDIVRLGRNYGIGCSLISQRPQSINKEVLSQVECLCVLQITGLHERKALEEWVQEAGEDRKLVGHLPSLQKGEGYVWSPSWLRIFKKVKFNKKTTFDTSATPKIGEATKSAKISKMDIERLREVMTTVVEKAKKETLDKKVLIDELNRLKKELSLSSKNINKEKIVNVTDTKALELARKEGWKSAEEQYFKVINEMKQINQEFKKRIDEYSKFHSNVQRLVGSVNFPELQKVNRNIETPKFKAPTPVSIPRINNFLNKRIDPPTEVNSFVDSDFKIKAGAIRMLKAVSQFGELTRAKTKTLAGISNATTFSTYIQDLKRNNLIAESNGLLRPTDDGIRAIEDIPDLPSDTDSLINLWSGFLKAGAIRMLKIAVAVYPESISRENLRNEADIQNPTTFSTYLQDLRRNGLIEIDGNEIKCSEDLI